MTFLRGFDPPGDKEVSGGDNHRYAMWDAAYVLGSLSSADRREFEAHMADCPSCREAVAQLSGMPALLSRLDRNEVAAINESDHTSGVPEMSRSWRSCCRRCWPRCVGAAGVPAW